MADGKLAEKLEEFRDDLIAKRDMDDTGLSFSDGIAYAIGGLVLANLLEAARELEAGQVPEYCDEVLWMKNGVRCCVLPKIGGGGLLWTARRDGDEVAKGAGETIGDVTVQVLDAAKQTKWWTIAAAEGE